MKQKDADIQLQNSIQKQIDIHMNSIISRDLAKLFHKEGIIFDSLFVYNDEQIINPKIVEKYGELSDDGYYELTKNCGGELDFDEVYIYESQLMLYYNVIINRNKYNAPSIIQVLDWLLKTHHIWIDSSLSPDGFIPLIHTRVNNNDNKFGYNIIPQDEYPVSLMHCQTPKEMYEKTIRFIIEQKYFQ